MLSLFLAKRYFLSKRSFFSKIFLFFTVSGIALGVYAMIVVLSVMKGFEDTVKGKILGVNAHMILYPQGGLVRNWNEIERKVLKVKGVKRVFPFVQGQVMLSSGLGSSGCVIRGVSRDFFEAFKKNGWMKYGRPPGKGEVIIGKDLSSRLGVFVGDRVRIIGTSGEFYLFGFVPKVREFRVSGIFEVGLYDFDEGVVFASLGDVMKFFNMDGAGGLEVYIEDPMEVDRIRELLRKRVEGFSIVTWKEMNRNLFSAMKLERIVMFIILGFMALVASFSVITTLFLSVLERKRDIAVIRAFGGGKGLVRNTFLLEGLFIGALGTFIGLALGIASVLVVENYRIIRLPDVYLIRYLPARLDLFYMIVTVLLSLILSIAGSMLPAHWAANIKPSEIIRHE